MTAELQRLRRHLRILDRDVDGVMQAHPEAIECRPGCSECCHQTFRVSEVEGATLAVGLAAAAPERRAAIVDRARAYRPDARVPCPVLDAEGRCSLYDHRPRICRKYGVPLWHPDRPHELRTCRLNFTAGAPDDFDLEGLVEAQAEWARDWIRLREELALGPQDNRTIAAWIVDADVDEPPSA